MKKDGIFLFSLFLFIAQLRINFTIWIFVCVCMVNVYAFFIYLSFSFSWFSVLLLLLLWTLFFSRSNSNSMFPVKNIFFYGRMTSNYSQKQFTTKIHNNHRCLKEKSALFTYIFFFVLVAIAKRIKCNLFSFHSIGMHDEKNFLLLHLPFTYCDMNTV